MNDKDAFALQCGHRIYATPAAFERFGTLSTLAASHAGFKTITPVPVWTLEPGSAIIRMTTVELVQIRENFDIAIRQGASVAYIPVPEIQGAIARCHASRELMGKVRLHDECRLESRKVSLVY